MRQVPVSREGFKLLHSYLSNHRAVLAGSKGDDYRPHKEDAVFLANDGEPFTIWGVLMLFKRLKKRTGIDGKRVSAHQCRRYMATTQLAMGRSPLDVQRQMGYIMLAITNYYAFLTVQHLQKSHEKYSPMRAEKVAQMRRLARVAGRNNYKFREVMTQSSCSISLTIGCSMQKCCLI